MVLELLIIDKISLSSDSAVLIFFCLKTNLAKLIQWKHSTREINLTIK
jgi:hypothetical protein